MQYKNPIVPGFHPDPSVCRVGSDYYLVNSSFEFFPGVPLFHSKNLIDWTQIGHVLDRKSQLNLTGCWTSGGIFAPTIRYNNGRFYMVTTNVTHGGNFYVWTDDINSGWSDPVFVDQGGIDPSLFFDDDGTVYFASTCTDDEGKSCIGQCTIDIETGEKLEETRVLWHGTGGKCPEGPHMYKINGKYYLMLAEGGTEYGHMETISRSDSPWGSWESCPHNPILTNREQDIRPEVLHALGHADLIEDEGGQWWILFHGIRTTQFMLHHIGRETMIAPVSWEDGWPVVNNTKNVGIDMSTDRNLPASTKTTFETHDKFSSDKLICEWSFLRNPNESCYSFGNGNGLIMSPSDCDVEGKGSPTWIGRRQQHMNMSTNVMLDYNPKAETDEAGINIFHTKEHHYDLVISRKNGKKVCFLRKRVADILVESVPIEISDDEHLNLIIESDSLEYRFYINTQSAGKKLIGTGSTQLVSTECMVCTFTGCFVGMFVNGCEKLIAKSFDYISI